MSDKDKSVDVGVRKTDSLANKNGSRGSGSAPFHCCTDSLGWSTDSLENMGVSIDDMMSGPSPSASEEISLNGAGIAPFLDAALCGDNRYFAAFTVLLPSTIGGGSTPLPNGIHPAGGGGTVSGTGWR